MNSTTTSTGEQISEIVTVTVRVPRSTNRTLFDAVKTRLEQIEGVASVSVLDSGGVSPRNSATYVTVTAEITVIEGMGLSGVVEMFEDEVSVETIEIVEACCSGS